MTFQEMLREYGIETAPGSHHHARRGWVQFDCPFCTPGSGRYRMGFNTYGKYVNCWTCGGHDLIETLEKLTGEPPDKVKPLLSELELPTGISVEKKKRGKYTPPQGLGDLLPIHKSYLRKRILDPDQAVKLWGLRGIGPLGGWLSWRVWIPITLRGETVSWTTRSVAAYGVTKKYITASPEEESVDHKCVLFGEDYVRHACIVCEGPMDAMRIGPGAVCTFGVNYTPAQVARIARYPVRVICFDNEPDAQKRARRLMDDLLPHPGETCNVTLAAKDASAAQEGEILKLRRSFLE